MDLLITILALVSSAIGFILLNLISDEVSAKLRPIGYALIRRAVALLPPERRPDYEEAWLSHFDWREGNLSKLYHALSVFYAALALRDYFEQRGSAPFIERSLTYRIITRLYFLADCFIYASLICGGILWLPILLFAFLSEVFLRRPLPLRHLESYFLALYYLRRYGQPIPDEHRYPKGFLDEVQLLRKRLRFFAD